MHETLVATLLPVCNKPLCKVLWYDTTPAVEASTKPLVIPKEAFTPANVQVKLGSWAKQREQQERLGVRL